MRQLSPEGRRIIEDLAQRHGFSVGAVTTMLHAISAGGSAMAQFDHPEFGGMGQWSRGGMTMIGDMFNNALKARVDGLCTDLAGLVSRQAPYGKGGQSQSQSQGGLAAGFSDSLGGDQESVSLFVPRAGQASDGWWPAGLGRPSSVGQQNNIRYAVFPEARRLVIDIAGRVQIYDTLDHRIGGVSQQQSGDASLTFTSQRGLVRLTELPTVPADDRPARAAEPPASPEQAAHTAPPPPPIPAASPGERASGRDAAAPPEASPSPAATLGTSDDIFAKLERLAGLRDKGILSEEEFAAKKTELLARL